MKVLREGFFDADSLYRWMSYADLHPDKAYWFLDDEYEPWSSIKQAVREQ